MEGETGCVCWRQGHGSGAGSQAAGLGVQGAADSLPRKQDTNMLVVQLAALLGESTHSINTINTISLISLIILISLDNLS